MIEADLTELVLPVMTTSLLGARLLRVTETSPDLVYLDSAHELTETFIELTLYFELLAPGGVMMGDDLNWFAVAHDLLLFARVHNTTVSSFDGCHEDLFLRRGMRKCVWFITKPARA